MLHRTVALGVAVLNRADEDDEDKKETEEEKDEDDDQRADDKDDDEKKTDQEDEDEEKRTDDSKSEKDSDDKEDDEVRTDITFTSGAAVTREDEDGPFQEVLGLEDGNIRLDYFNSGNAPVLDSHRGDSLSSILGVVEKAWIESDGNTRSGKATIRFSKRSDVKEIVDDIRNGIIRNCSIGYRVYRFEDSEDKAGTRIRTAVDFEPLELSLCPIGADNRAGFRAFKEGSKRNMDAKISSTSNTKVEPEVKFVADNLVVKERQRGIEIREAVKLASLETSMADDWVMKGTPIDEARRLILEKLSERSKAQSQSSLIMPGSYDEKEVMQRGIVDALLTRHDSKKFTPTDAGRKFQNYTLADLARTTLGERSERIATGDVITRSFQSTSDFPMLLSNFMGRLLREGFQAAPQTWRTWTRQSIARDFRPQFRIMLSDAALLEPLNENGEFKSSSLDEGAESIQVKTYGRTLNISRAAIVNDDLNAFSRLPELLATASNNLIGDTVYKLLKANPVMKTDGINCFDKKHNNVGVASALSIQSLTEARKAMRLQKTMKGQPLGLTPKYLLTTANNEIAAMQILSMNYLAGVIESTTSQKINPFMGTMDVIIEPRLDGIMGPDVWFNIVDPSQLDTMEICFLNGQDSPYIESQVGFSVDGITLKARIDFGASILEWRGLHKNEGKNNS